MKSINTNIYKKSDYYRQSPFAEPEHTVRGVISAVNREPHPTQYIVMKVVIRQAVYKIPQGEEWRESIWTSVKLTTTASPLIHSYLILFMFLSL